MNIVFMGTPDFAVPILRALADRYSLLAVYTRPDAASGRGKRLLPPPVKRAALELGLPVIQPASLRTSDVRDQLIARAPDVICVAAYGMILPPDILAIPRLGCINVHASLLPRWRGAAPVHRAILAADATTGVSIMRMEEGLDTGPTALQVSTPIGELTAEQLTLRLAALGATALLDVLDRLADVTWSTQDDALATYALKVTRADVALSPELTVAEALRRIRASGSSAPARLTVQECILTVVSASSTEVPLAPGEVSAGPKALLIGMADGSLSLDMIRPAGKGGMCGSAWVCGARLDDTCTWQAL